MLRVALKRTFTTTYTVVSNAHRWWRCLLNRNQCKCTSILYRIINHACTKPFSVYFMPVKYRSSPFPNLFFRNYFRHVSGLGLARHMLCLSWPIFSFNPSLLTIRVRNAIPSNENRENPKRKCSSNTALRPPFPKHTLMVNREGGKLYKKGKEQKGQSFPTFCIWKI